MKHILRLTALLLICLVLIGCAQDNTPYTEQTAQIDPAMNLPDDPHAQRASDGTDSVSTTGDADALSLGLGPGDKVELTDAQWKSILSSEEFYILRQSGTERAFTGRYHNHPLDKKGAFHCLGCGNYLYDAEHKFHSGCGWPSFYQAVTPGAITEHHDTSHGMVRTEMRCARCDSHLGHIFNDGFGTPTGMRHCVNSAAIIFVPEGEDVKDVIRAHREKFAHR